MRALYAPVQSTTHRFTIREVNGRVAVQDVLDAIQWAKQKAKELGVDTKWDDWAHFRVPADDELILEFTVEHKEQA